MLQKKAMREKEEGESNEIQGKMRKEELLEEIKKTIKLKNNYKNATINLLAFLNQIDPIQHEIIKLFEGCQQTLFKIKKDKIQGAKYEEMASKVSGSDMRFLETGTLIKGNTFKHLMKNLLMENKEQYQMLSQREKEKEAQIKNLVKDLRNRIFDEKFTLYREREGKNIEILKQELEGMFGKYKNLQNSDFVILNTFFNDYDPEEFNMDKVLFKVTNKLIDIADQNLQDSKNV